MAALIRAGLLLLRLLAVLGGEAAWGASDEGDPAEDEGGQLSCEQRRRWQFSPVGRRSQAIQQRRMEVQRQSPQPSGNGRCGAAVFDQIEEEVATGRGACAEASCRNKMRRRTRVRRRGPSNSRFREDMI
jgi:hypothetical protein